MTVKALAQNELEAFRCRVAVVAISYCWRAPNHPDPDGQTLLEISKVLEKQRRQRGSKNYDDDLFKNWPQEVGVFMDYCSMFQQERSEDEGVCFRMSLKDLDLFYAHQWTTVFLLTSTDVAPSYHDRGWPTYEYALACLVKTTVNYQWDSALDLGDPESRPLSGAPLTKAALQDLLSTKTFTNGADKDLVVSLYERTLTHAYSGSREMVMDYRGWDSSHVVKFAPMLQMCPALESLSFAANEIDDEGLKALLAELDAGCTPNLARLKINQNQITDAGFGLFVAALSRGQLSNLKTLAFGQNKIGSPAVFEALGTAFSSGAGKHLEELEMQSSTECPDPALAAFADALTEGALPELTSIDIIGALGTGDEACQSLASALQRGAMPKLSKCTFGCTAVTRKGKSLIEKVRNGIKVTL
jgi:hypothetical protein